MLVNTYSGFSIAFVCGPPGSGKSYIMTRDVMRRLVETEVRVVTNLPLNVQEIAEEVARRRKCEPEEIAARIILIDKDDLKVWKTGRIPVDGRPIAEPAGPWDWEDEFCQGAELILDECHLYCPKSGLGAPKIQKAWTDYLGEARHRGWARIVFVTQDESKVGQAITSHAELRYELTNTERLRDPFFKVPLSDWYEVIASVTREFRPVVALVEYRRIVGKLKLVHSERITLDPEGFKYYRSHEAAGGGTGEGAIQRPLREFEKRPTFWGTRDARGRKVAPVWRWFLWRHWWRFAFASVLVVVGGWLTIGGGLSTVMSSFVRGFSGQVAKRIDKGEKAPLQGVAKTQSPSPPGADVAARPGAPPAGAFPGENAKETTDAAFDAKVNPRALAAAMAAIPEREREVIQHAMRAATGELRKRQAELDAERAKVAAPAEEPVVETPLPVVSAFLGRDAVVVEGRKVKVGESILLDGGKRRVKVRKIDRTERVVYLEDSRILRFAPSSGMSVVGGIPPERVPDPAPAAVPAGVQPMGQSPESQSGESLGGAEKSIVVRRADAGE